MKKCSKCKIQKDVGEFYSCKTTVDGLQGWCKECFKERAKTRPKQVRTTEDIRRHYLSYQFNMTPAMFDDILASQGDKCATCPAVPVPGKRNFHVDHDHLCCPGARSCGKCVRGILCGNCNKALGFVNDNVETLDNLKEYVLAFR